MFRRGIPDCIVRGCSAPSSPKSARCREHETDNICAACGKRPITTDLGYCAPCSKKFTRKLSAAPLPLAERGLGRVVGHQFRPIGAERVSYGNRKRPAPLEIPDDVQAGFDAWLNGGVE